MVGSKYSAPIDMLIFFDLILADIDISSAMYRITDIITDIIPLIHGLDRSQINQKCSYST